MASRYSETFVDAFLETLLGVAGVPSAAEFGYMRYYTGVMALAPDIAPAGSFVNTAASQGAQLLAGARLSAAVAGVSQITPPLNTIGLADISGTVTTARIIGSDLATGLIDTPVTLVDGGGGVIVPTLSAVSGTVFTADAFVITLPEIMGQISMNNALRNDLLNAFCRNIILKNVAALSSATITIYSGTPPNSANDAATGTALWTATTAAAGASWDTVIDGEAELAANITANAIATGTATYLRITKGTYVLQGSVGTSGAAFTVGTTSMVSGVSNSITEALITITPPP